VGEVVEQAVGEELHRQAVDDDRDPGEQRRAVATAALAQRVHQREDGAADHQQLERDRRQRQPGRVVDRDRPGVDERAHGAASRLSAAASANATARGRR